jgi:hypothetical protein
MLVNIQNGFVADSGSPRRSARERGAADQCLLGEYFFKILMFSSLYSHGFRAPLPGLCNWNPEESLSKLLTKESNRFSRQV